MEDFNPKDYQTRLEVSKLLGVSTQTLRHLEKRGEGPPVVRFSERKALYPNTGLVLFLKSRTVGSEA